MGNTVPFIGPLPMGVPRPMVDRDTGKIVPTTAPAGNGGSKPAGNDNVASPNAEAARQAQIARERAAAEAAAEAARAALAEAQRQAREALQRAQKAEQEALEAEDKARRVSAKNKDEAERKATTLRDKANTAWAELTEKKADESLAKKQIALQDAKKKNADNGLLSSEASKETKQAQAAYDTAHADKTSASRLVDAAEAQASYHEAEARAADAEIANSNDAPALRNQADIAKAKSIDADAAYGVAEAERELKALEAQDKPDAAKLQQAKDKLAAARDDKAIKEKVVAAAEADAKADAAEREATARPHDEAAAKKAKNLRDTANLAITDIGIADQQARANTAQRSHAQAQQHTRDLDDKLGKLQTELDTATAAKDDKETKRLQGEVDTVQGQLFAARQAESKAKGTLDTENTTLKAAKAGREYDAALQDWTGTADVQRDYGKPQLVTKKHGRGGEYTSVHLDERYDKTTFAVPVDGNKVSENNGEYSLEYKTAQHDLPCYADKPLNMPRTAKTVISKEDGHWVMEVDGPRGSKQKLRLNDDAAKLWDAYVAKSGAEAKAKQVDASATTAEADRKALDLSKWLGEKADIEKAVADTKKQVETARGDRSEWIDQWRKDHGATDPRSADYDGWRTDPGLKPHDDELALALENQAVALANQNALKKMLALDEAERRLYDVEHGKVCVADSTDMLRGKVKTARKEASDAVQAADKLQGETEAAQKIEKETPAKLADARSDLADKNEKLAAARKTGDEAKITAAERASELARLKAEVYEDDIAWSEARHSKTVDDDNYSRQYTDPKHSTYAALPAPNYSIAINSSGTVSSSTLDLRSASSASTRQELDDAAKARDASRQAYNDYAQQIGEMEQAEADKPKVDTEVKNATTGLSDAQKALDEIAPNNAAGRSKAQAAVDDAQQTLNLALKHQQAVDATLRWADADRTRLAAEARDRSVGRDTDYPSEATKTARQEAADARTQAHSLHADWTKAQQKHGLDKAQRHFDTLNSQHQQWLDANPGADASRAPGYQSLIDAEDALIKAKGAQLQGAANAAQAKQQAFLAQHLDPSKRDDPAALDELFRKDPLLMAQGLINQSYVQTGGQAVDMASRTHLKNTVALALGWQPTQGLDTSDAGAAAATLRTRDVFADLDKDEAKLLDTLVDRITEKGGATPTITVVPVAYSNKETGIVSTALFRVEGQDGKVYYIDNQGGYGSGKTNHDAVEDWRDNNTLSPDDVLVMPEDGELKLDDDGNVRLTKVAANHESTWDKVHPWLSAGVAVVGIVAGVVVTVGSAGILSAPGAVMVGAGVAGLADGAAELHRMATHGQSIDPRENKQALLTQVSMLSCALGTVASGARAGLELTKVGTAARVFGQTSNVTGLAAAGTGGYAMAHSTVDLAVNWDRMSASDRGWGVFNTAMGGVGMVSGAAARRGKAWLDQRGAVPSSAPTGDGTTPAGTRSPARLPREPELAQAAKGRSADKAPDGPWYDETLQRAALHPAVNEELVHVVRNEKAQDALNTLFMLGKLTPEQVPEWRQALRDHFEDEARNIVDEKYGDGAAVRDTFTNSEENFKRQVREAWDHLERKGERVEIDGWTPLTTPAPQLYQIRPSRPPRLETVDDFVEALRVEPHPDWKPGKEPPRGITPQAARIAEALKRGDIKLHLLGEQAFRDAYDKPDSDPPLAFARGNQIFLKRDRAPWALLLDVVHEGTHALDHATQLDIGRPYEIRVGREVVESGAHERGSPVYVGDLEARAFSHQIEFARAMGLSSEDHPDFPGLLPPKVSEGQINAAHDMHDVHAQLHTKYPTATNWDLRKAADPDNPPIQYQQPIGGSGAGRLSGNGMDARADTPVTVTTLAPSDPLFKKLVEVCQQNYLENPYPTDALHEGGPVMLAYMNQSDAGPRRLANTVKAAVTSPSFWRGNAKAEQPELVITRIEVIENPSLSARYIEAKREIEARTGSANVQWLYSGHSPDGMNYITEHGHDPNYGAFDSKRKGHGAHGRGAYFTPLVAKAITYSGQTPGEERSFFLQEVLLGNALEYSERGVFRFNHHNEMVRPDRFIDPAERGINVGSGLSPDEAEALGFNRNGISAHNPEEMAMYDSLVGTQSYDPGKGIIGTIKNRKRFDSDEYMVRNGDQILPKYRIYYTLNDPSRVDG